LDAAKATIPISTEDPPHKYSIWWTPECTQARTEKRRALNRYKNHLGDLNLWISYKIARARFRQTTNTAQKQCWARFLDKITNRTSLTEVWTHIRMLQHNKRKIYRSPLLKVDGQYLSTPPAVADSLAQYFSRSGTFSKNPAFLAHKQQAEREPIVFSEDNSAN
jgi:hypothetical protein